MSAWDNLIEPLTDAYLRWKYSLPSENVDDLHCDQATQDPSSMHVDSDSGGLVSCTVETYDLWSTNKTLTVMRKQTSDSAAIDIMAHGYLVKSPT